MDMIVLIDVIVFDRKVEGDEVMVKVVLPLFIVYVNATWVHCKGQVWNTIITAGITSN